MRFPFLLFLLAACGTPAQAVDPPAAPKKAVRFPVPKAAPTPMPAPVQPGTADKLAANEFYVFESDEPLIVLASPEGFVSISHDAGPIKLKGRFAVDGTGGNETRTYSGKHVYTVEATHTGKIELLTIPAGAPDAKDVVRKPIDVDAGEAPRPPPPKPVDPPKPIDPVVPPKPEITSPFSEPGFRVLIVYDSAKTTRTPEELSVANGTQAMRDYMDAKCVVGPDPKEIDDTGKPMREWRIWPANSDVSKVRPVFKAAFEKKGGNDWILIGDGKTGYSGPLPKSEIEAIELLKKYGG